MKRILHFPGVMTQGGVESLIMGWYKRVDKKAIQFDFCVSRDYPAPIDDIIKKLGGRVFYTSPMRKSGLLNHLRKIKKIIRENGPYDAVHIHSIHMGVVALVAAKQCNIKTRIYHSHNIQNATLSTLPLFLRRNIEKICSIIINKYATKRVACSNEAGRFVFRESPFVVIKNAIDLNRFKPDDEEYKLSLRKKLGIPSDSIVVGNVGRFVKEKNQKLFLDLYDYDRRNGGDLFFLLVGDGNERKVLESIVSDKKAQSSFMFVGSQESTEAYYNCMNVFCLPSLYEGLGIVAIEAQACGIPCLVSNGVPKEADMGLGYFLSLNLNAHPSEWCAALYKLSKQKRLEKNTIQEQINKKGYSIDDVMVYIEKMLYN